MIAEKRKLFFSFPQRDSGRDLGSMPAGQHQDNTEPKHRKTITFSLPSDVQFALQQHKAGLLYKAFLVTQPQQLALGELPSKSLVVLMSSLPEDCNREFDISGDFITHMVVCLELT